LELEKRNNVIIVVKVDIIQEPVQNKNNKYSIYIKMEWGQQMRKHQQNARDAMYQNTNYSFERRERKTLIIDQDNFPVNSPTTINTTLFEPLIIDKLSDVYLESVLTFGCVDKDDPKDLAFLLSIDQFNINTNIASNTSGTNNYIKNPHSFNKILIPNEHDGPGAATESRIHKAKKLNYVCSINPTKISNITGTITNMDNITMWHPEAEPTLGHRLIVELVIIARD
jgi:hypothetical protein